MWSRNIHTPSLVMMKSDRQSTDVHPAATYYAQRPSTPTAAGCHRLTMHEATVASSSKHHGSNRLVVGATSTQIAAADCHFRQATACITQASSNKTEPLTPNQHYVHQRCKSQLLQNVSPPSAMALPYRNFSHTRRHMLVLDLDETLVHASVQEVAHDFSLFVDIEGQCVQIFVRMRPYVREFLQIVSRIFEVAAFTASLEKYAGRVMDVLDPHNTIFAHRLYRERCTEVDGSYVKDLALLGRPMDRVVIVDNSPTAYMFNRENAIPIPSWFDDISDTELLKLLPLLEAVARSSAPLQVIRNRFGNN